MLWTGQNILNSEIKKNVWLAIKEGENFKIDFKIQLSRNSLSFTRYFFKSYLYFFDQDIT